MANVGVRCGCWVVCLRVPPKNHEPALARTYAPTVQMQLEVKTETRTNVQKKL